MTGYVWMKFADQTFAVVAPNGEIVGQWDHLEAAQQQTDELNTLHDAYVERTWNDLHDEWLS